MKKIKFKLKTTIIVLATIISVFGFTPAVAQTHVITRTLAPSQIAEIRAQINILMAQITALQAQLDRMIAGTISTPIPARFNINSFSTNFTNINQGSTATLTWNTTETTNCRIESKVIGYAETDPKNVNSNGTRNVSPFVTTTYILTCNNRGNINETKRAEITINVIPLPQNHSLAVFIHGVGGGEVRGPAFSCLANFCRLIGISHGTQINLTAIPHPGWIFDGWTGDCTGRTGTCNVSMTTIRNVVATFRQEQPVSPPTTPTLALPIQ